MYTIEKNVNLNPAKGYWLPMALQDAALLHAFIFCADGHGTISQGRKEGPAALIHLRKAIQMVNERLRAPVPIVTDATIAVVCRPTEIIEELGISCWHDLDTLFKSFFWVEKIHRGTFRPIWDALEAYSPAQAARSKGKPSSSDFKAILGFI